MRRSSRSLDSSEFYNDDEIRSLYDHYVADPPKWMSREGRSSNLNSVYYIHDLTIIKYVKLKEVLFGIHTKKDHTIALAEKFILHS